MLIDINNLKINKIFIKKEDYYLSLSTERIKNFEGGIIKWGGLFIHLWYY